MAIASAPIWDCGTFPSGPRLATPLAVPLSSTIKTLVESTDKVPSVIVASPLPTLTPPSVPPEAIGNVKLPATATACVRSSAACNPTVSEMKWLCPITEKRLLAIDVSIRFPTSRFRLVRHAVTASNEAVKPVTFAMV